MMILHGLVARAAVMVMDGYDGRECREQALGDVVDGHDRKKD